MVIEVFKSFYLFDTTVIKEIDDIFESDVDEVKSLSDLHEGSLDGLDGNLFGDSGGNGDSESNRVEEEFDNEVIEMNAGEEYKNVKLLEGYESNDNDVFYNDSENESSEAKISRMVRGQPFKVMVGGEIRYKVRQTHDTIYSLREQLREYAIQEGINFVRVKNDRKTNSV
ncbi:hypothetical protein ACOSQ4_010149 [Xanthoceras sorbifolium]